MPDRVPFPVLPPPLPRVVAPVNNETTASYIGRLARRNHVPVAYLNDRLGTPEFTERQNLAALTRIPEDRLVLAMPNLHPDPSSVAVLRGRPSRHRQIACHHCASRRGHGDLHIEVLVRHEDVLCARHRLWLNQADSPARQLPIHDHPMLLAAARRHRRLIRQHGRATVHTAFIEASHLVGHYALGFQHEPRMISIWKNLAARVNPAQRPASWALSCYPWAVAMTSILIATPRGHAWLTAPPHLRDTIRARIAQEITGGYIPTGARDVFMSLAERDPWPAPADAW